MAVTLAPTYLPHIQCFTTGVSGVVTQVNLPAYPHLALVVHNRDQSSKNAMISFDQTLVDGGAAPAAGGLTIDAYLNYNINGNGANGLPSVTKAFIFSLTHNSVNIELMLSTAKPAN
jgi:hypothetical protein